MIHEHEYTKHLTGCLKIVLYCSTGYNSFPDRIPKSCLLQASLLLHGTHSHCVRDERNAFVLRSRARCVQRWSSDTRATICWNYKRESINIKWHLGKVCESNGKIHELYLESMVLRQCKKFSQIGVNEGMFSCESTGVYVVRNCSKQFMSCILRISYAHLNNMCC